MYFIEIIKYFWQTCLLAGLFLAKTYELSKDFSSMFLSFLYFKALKKIMCQIWCCKLGVNNFNIFKSVTLVAPGVPGWEPLIYVIKLWCVPVRGVLMGVSYSDMFHD